MPIDRRASFRKSLSHLYVPYYDALCEELGPHWQPYQGTRTFPYQASLYAQGRTTCGPESSPSLPLGKTVTNAKPGESAHNYGCATDWTLWKRDNKPIWTREDPRWGEYFVAIEKVGLRAGKDFGDWPHNELKLKCRWVRILEEYQNAQMAAAEALIQKSLVT